MSHTLRTSSNLSIMDQLQLDAMKSYASLSYRPRRRDSAQSVILKSSMHRGHGVSQDVESGQQMANPSRSGNLEVVSACTGNAHNMLNTAASTSHAGPSTYQAPGGSLNTSNVVPPSCPVEHIMLCFVGANSAKRLQQIRLFPQPSSNAAFFRRLKFEYKSHRKPGKIRQWSVKPFWRKVESIHFIQFVTLRPTIRPKTTQWIRIMELNVLPTPEGDWVRTLGPGSPINPFDMQLWMDNPSQPGEIGLCQFEQLPRKLNGRIPLEEGHVGWGLFFHEVTDWCVLGWFIAAQVVLLTTVAFAIGY